MAAAAPAPGAPKLKAPAVDAAGVAGGAPKSDIRRSPRPRARDSCRRPPHFLSGPDNKGVSICEFKPPRLPIMLVCFFCPGRHVKLEKSQKAGGPLVKQTEGISPASVLGVTPPPMATASEAAAPMAAVGARVGAGPLEDDSASRRIPLLAAGAAVLLTMQATVSFHKGVSHPVGGEPEDTSNLKFGSLSLFASFLFVLFSNALSRWDPTRGMGKVLVARVTSMVGNWQNETLRSFVELFIWMGVMWATFTANERGFFSLLCATMSGAVVVLCGGLVVAAVGVRRARGELRGDLRGGSG